MEKQSVVFSVNFTYKIGLCLTFAEKVYASLRDCAFIAEGCKAKIFTCILLRCIN